MSAALALIGTLVSPLTAPVVTALQSAESDPQGALKALATLAGSEIGDLPDFEDEAISEGAKLALEAFSALEAKLNPPEVPDAPAPESAPTV